MPICPHCGQTHKTGSRFCTRTGTLLPSPAVCPHCFNDLSRAGPNALFCPFCGLELWEAGAWPMEKGNPARLSSSLEPVVFPLRKVWVFPDGGTGVGEICSSPVVWGETLYIGSADRSVYALNKRTGKPRWNRPTKGAVTASPLVATGAVLVPSTDGRLYALAPETGVLRWAFPGEGALAPLHASPLLCRGTLVLATGDGRVIGLEGKSGTLLWEFPEKGSVGTLTGAPAFSAGQVLVASEGKYVFSLALETGKLLWRFPRRRAARARFRGGPVCFKGRVYIADRSGKVYSLALKTGEDRWMDAVEVEGTVESSPAVGFGRLFLGTGAEYLYALDLQTGGILWRERNPGLPVLDAITASPLLAANQRIVTASCGGYITIRDFEGTELWKTRLESEIRAAPVLSDGYLFAVCKGRVYGFHR
ncbi:MAG: PQQ-binding-like beta-propeller repeat protein [Armatimonadetes bacterium]|nr:PQQ-binding-like beta-propeller repeat protein [Armatimonadota bacterium]